MNVLSSNVSMLRIWHAYTSSFSLLISVGGSLQIIVLLNRECPGLVSRRQELRATTHQWCWDDRKARLSRS